MAGERVAHPLFEEARERPDAIFPVVVRIRTYPANIVPAKAGAPTQAERDAALVAAYDAVPARLEAVENALAQIGAKPPRWSGRAVHVPYLYTELTGAQILALDEALPPDVPAEISRGRADADHAQGFDPANLVGRVIAEPLATHVFNDPTACHDVIIVISEHHPGGRDEARAQIVRTLELIKTRIGDLSYRDRPRAANPYVFANMTGEQILALLELDGSGYFGERAIFRIWEDTKVQALITRSIATVKADAAQAAFTAVGTGIVWAVLDSGIDAAHPHFALYNNLKLSPPLVHKNFVTRLTDADATVDKFGHGTHVAGIIAGAWPVPPSEETVEQPPPDPSAAAVGNKPVVLRTARNEAGAEERSLAALPTIAGMAPRCKLLSMRVLDDAGTGQVSWIIDALDEIQRLNDYGRTLVIHGVNLSVGYNFDAKWFACGQSPLCVEVDRLVRSGVVVVAAAGNSGYGYVNTAFTNAWAMGLPMTINDPGNADLAITVGSTHKDAPHRYGISYFSSKGPTGDGRMKPDLVAPGERIVSCASAQSRKPATVAAASGGTVTATPNAYTYKEDSGTSMAAPHVSGLVAAFLSIRGEYIGQPETVKQLFVSNATDLRRDRAYQGAGLVDLMRTIQAV
ncbi:MAG: serine protease AprX [Candidatus Eremiobacteraeota bacterium]|jgi:subtilisin family serine protease|nr:serine protease AprX [Candidatus Eremiobacteraeota bacterium]